LYWCRKNTFDVRVASKFYFFLALTIHPAQLPRGLLLFVLIQKVTKKIKSAERLLGAQGLSRTKPKKLRAGIFLPDDPFWRRPCNAKISYALPGALGLQFFRLLPEAYLLTVPIKASGK